MNRLSIMAAAGLCLGLLPLALSGASADPASNTRPAHETPTFFDADREPLGLAAQAQAGAFLEMTDAAP